MDGLLAGESSGSGMPYRSLGLLVADCALATELGPEGCMPRGHGHLVLAGLAGVESSLLSRTKSPAQDR